MIKLTKLKKYKTRLIAEFTIDDSLKHQIEFADISNKTVIMNAANMFIIEIPRQGSVKKYHLAIKQDNDILFDLSLIIPRIANIDLENSENNDEQMNNQKLNSVVNDKITFNNSDLIEYVQRMIGE